MAKAPIENRLQDFITEWIELEGGYLGDLDDSGTRCVDGYFNLFNLSRAVLDFLEEQW